MALGHDAIRADQQAGQYRQIGGLAYAQPEEIRNRRANAEQAYTNVVSRLGAEGTYGPDAPTQTAEEANASVFKNKTLKSNMGGSFGKTVHVNSKQLDLNKFQKQTEASTQFKLMSKLTAEADQLVNRSGPLYDEMLNNTQLPIIEGAASLARENTETLRKAMQRGGAARRNAFDTVQQMRSQERINSTKAQQLADTRFNIDKWSRDNARDVLSFGQNWASNLGGIRESYQAAMDHAADLMTTSALPIVAQVEGRAEAADQRSSAIRAQIHAERREKTGRWISGILSVGSMLLGGGLLGAAIPGLGSLGGAAASAGGAAAGTGALGAAATGGTGILGAAGRFLGPEMSQKAGGQLLEWGASTGISALTGK